MAGVAFAVEGDGVGFATESYAASALYTTLANLSGAFWRIRRVRCNFLAWCWVHPDAGWLSGKQFGNADQVIGDQIEQEVGGDASDATMFGLAHGAMLLAPSEDALDHRPARLRDAIAWMPGGSFVDGAVAGLAGFGDGLVLCHMRRHADGAKIGDMIGGIVRLVLTGRDA